MRVEMRITVCRSSILGCFVEITSFVHMLHCFPVQWNYLRSIAFNVHRCMQKAELSTFIISAQGSGTGTFQKGL